MPEIKSADKLKEEILKFYNRNPENWYAFSGIDDENYLTSLFLHEGKVWIIKEFPINPYKFIGLGSKTNAKKIKSNLFSFGLRPLNKKEAKNLLLGKISTVKKVFEKAPVALDECHTNAKLLVEGPVIAYHKEKLKFSEAQEKLELNLRKSLRKLIMREHSDILRAYV
ncbi:MAG: hypothetical protein QXY62_01025 [Candidatus Altiarchaeota archaeon]